MSVAAVSAPLRAQRSETMLGRALRGLRGSRKATLGAVVLVFLLLLAAFGPFIAIQDPYDLTSISIMDAKLAPGSESMDGMRFWLGTDGQGRDMVSAMIYGLRTSIGVGISSGIFALMLGTAIGLTAAYYGGKTDAFLMRIVDLMLSLPTVLVALMLLAALGQGVAKVILALVLVQWAYFARAVRAAAMVERRKEYVEAAVGLGFGRTRILFSQILPNCLPPIIVIGTLQVAHAISTEATLSFLGIGLPITQPSLGLLIANGYKMLMSGQYWISIYPGFLLLTLVFSINIVGDRLREVFNPRLNA